MDETTTSQELTSVLNQMSDDELQQLKEIISNQLVTTDGAIKEFDDALSVLVEKYEAELNQVEHEADQKEKELLQEIDAGAEDAVRTSLQ